MLNIPACVLFFSANFFALNPLSAFKHSDSSWVYYTAQQFENDERQNECACVLREKVGFIWSWFPYDAEGVLRSKEKSGTVKHKYYEPGSIYGFGMNGIKFRWVKEEKKYLAVLSNVPSRQFFVRESVSHGFKTSFSNGIILYRTNDSTRLKKFNRKNIESDFKGSDSGLKRMLSLLNVLEKYTDYLNRRSFFKCREIIGQTPE